MARRATGIAKAPAPTKAGRLGDSTRALAGTAPALRAIPMTLAPLLAPYKKLGRISIRIERLHQLARLSAGRNNGDCSWSLTLDELEDLAYLTPEGMDEAQTLAIRIIEHEDGSTLAVLDYPIPPPGAEDETFELDENDGEHHNTELRLLRDELAKAKANFAARESEIATGRQKAEESEMEASRQQVAAELARARAAWEGELEGRLAAAAAQVASNIEQDRLATEKAWKAEEAARLAATEAKWQENAARALEEARIEAERARDAKAERELARLRDELKAAQSTLAARETELSKARQAAEEAEAESAPEKPGSKRGRKGDVDEDKFASLTAGLLVRQDEAWRAAAAAPAGAWPQPSADTSLDGFLVPKGGARPSSVAQPTADFTFAERSNGWDETPKSSGGASEPEIPLPPDFQYTPEEVQRLLAEELEHWRQDWDEALADAEIAWKAEEAARLAAAQALWQEEAAKALAHARTQSDAARDQVLQTELDRLLGECAGLSGTLSKREAALAQANLAVQQAQEAAERQIKEAQTRAEAVWKAGEAARIATLEAQWQEKSAHAVAELRSAAEARDHDVKTELSRVREELAAAQADIAQRQSALDHAALAAEQAQNRARQELEEALAQAKAGWKSEEAARTAALEAAWQENSAKMAAELRSAAEENDRVAKSEVGRLREELAVAQAGLAERQNALVQAGLASEEAKEHRRHELEAALAAAQANWKAQEAERIAALEAAWQETSAQAVAALRSTAEAKDRGLAIELERLREELKTAQAALAERQNALVQAGLSSEQANERARQELDAALAKATTTWKTEEAQRFVAAEAEWQEQAARSTAEAVEAQARANALREQAHEQERVRLREELAAMKAALVESQSAMVRMGSTAEEARKRAQQEAEEALAKAEAAWKAGEAARLEAANAGSRKQIASAFAEMTIQCERAETALAQAHAQAEAFASQDRDLHRTRQELAAAQAALAERDAALSRAKSSGDELQKRWQKEAAETLSRAETVWKADEAARLAAAEAQWQEKSNLALTEAQAQPDATRDSANEAELRHLREELAASQAALADRKAALVRAGMAIEETRERWQNEMETTLAKARTEWKADQAARLAAVEAQWQEKSAKALAEANARGSGMDLRNLREELAALQSTLWDRDIELAVARAAREEKHEEITEENAIVLKPDRIGGGVDSGEQRPKRRLFRDIAIAASLAAAAVVAYPIVAPHIVGLSGAAPASSSAADAAEDEANMVVVNHAANVRADASAAAAVTSNLPRGAKVVAVEKRGSWTLVRIEDTSGKTEPRQGWVASSFLDAADASQVKRD